MYFVQKFQKLNFLLIFNTNMQPNPLKVLKALAQISSVPIYSSWDTFMGSGILGGRLLSAEITGRLMARYAIEIILGTPARDIQVTPEEITCLYV